MYIVDTYAYTLVNMHMNIYLERMSELTRNIKMVGNYHNIADVKVRIKSPRGIRDNDMLTTKKLEQAHPNYYLLMMVAFMRDINASLVINLHSMNTLTIIHA
jgi:hypothetical protein